MDWISGRPDQAAAGPAELIGREPEIQQLRLFVDRISQGAALRDALADTSPEP